MKINRGTAIRTVVLFFLILNQILTVLGRNPLPFTGDEAGSFVSSMLTATASLWAWWKNNSFTSAAKAGDELMKKIKEET